jgi:uncharacterized protein YwlG (UPF0340 family)
MTSIIQTIDIHKHLNITLTIDIHKHLNITLTIDIHEHLNITLTIDIHKHFNITLTIDIHKHFNITLTIDIHKHLNITLKIIAVCKMIFTALGNNKIIFQLLKYPLSQLSRLRESVSSTCAQLLISSLTVRHSHSSYWHVSDCSCQLKQ